MKKSTWSLFVLSLLFLGDLYATGFSIEAEDMVLSGKYAGKISSPFSGIALYTNNDQGAIDIGFPQGDGIYKVMIAGASSNTSSAGVALYINGIKLKDFFFQGTDVSVATEEITISGLHLSANEIVLLLESDNGSNDTYIDKLSFTYLEPIVVREPPVLPEQGAFYTGVYRNMLKEYGYTDTQISDRLNYLWDFLFAGDEATQRVYYPVGEDEAYILDTGNEDIRSEGMSYGMMICVQLDRKEEFDRLWKWAKTRMQIQTGAQTGYFAWQIKTDGSNRSTQTAPDGDEYFAMALLFAAGRWGSGEGIYDYWKEANYILENSMAKGHLINSSTTNMFDEKEKQVVFVPYASSAKHTDPSYHLPAFYQLWGAWADNQRWFWNELASKSREMFSSFAHPETGLMPDYANFDGTPTGGNHADFRFDAWRCAMNMAIDYSWFKLSDEEVNLINRLHNFFASKGIKSYKNQYSLSGRELSGGDHSPGLVACNAAGALASNQTIAWEFIEDFFTMSMTTGRYRYYDGLLYFLNYLKLSGNYRIYRPKEVLEVAFDEQYRYEDGYLLVDDFESKSIEDSYYMRRTEGSSATASVVSNPVNSSDKSLRILPGNYDEYFYLKYKLPADKALGADYTHLEFDIFYEPSGDNQKQDLKVDFNTIQSTPFYKTSTGEKAGHGRWEHIVVPLDGAPADNVFKLYIGIRTRNANYCLDNIKLKEKNQGSGLFGEKADKTPVFIYEQNSLCFANGGKGDICLFSIQGQPVLSAKETSCVDLSYLPTGVYVIRMDLQGERYLTKIVK